MIYSSVERPRPSRCFQATGGPTVTFEIEAEAYVLVRAATNLPNSAMDALLDAETAGGTGRAVTCDPIEADQIRQWFDTARAITADPEKVRACSDAVDAIDEALHGQAL